MESMIGLAETATAMARSSERLHSVLKNLSSLTVCCHSAENAVRVVANPDILRVRHAEAELARAKLELAVKQARAEWSGFVAVVEELFASLEAAPLLSVCPD